MQKILTPEKVRKLAFCSLNRNFAFIKAARLNITMKSGSNARYYAMAIGIVAIWGSTFATTKILITGGVSPIGIFFIRFLLAYLIMLAIDHRTLLATTWKDEAKFCLSGILGGSLYYWLQNTALSLSQTTNVSFLLSFCPLITILLAILFFHDQHITRWHLLGLLVALCGVGFVIFNGQVELRISPRGDILALLAAVSWGFYTQLIRPLTGRYSTGTMSRKVFFYGWLTAVPLFLSGPWQEDIASLHKVPVALSILYLTVFASVYCYMAWNRIILKLGPVRSASFLYLDPVFSTLCSLLFMDEVMTPMLAMGLVFILGGVFLAQRAGGHRGSHT